MPKPTISAREMFIRTMIETGMSLHEAAQEWKRQEDMAARIEATNV